VARFPTNSVGKQKVRKRGATLRQNDNSDWGLCGEVLGLVVFAEEDGGG
jgi:hypothetical protein